MCFVTRGAYNWVGFGVGSIAVLLSASALVQELRTRPIDGGSVGFDLVFGLFWAGIATSCGYALLHSRGKEASSGCLFIALVFGGLLVLTGGALLVPNIGAAQQVDPIAIAIFFVMGALLVVPSSLLLWHRRNPDPEAGYVRLWQGVVAGGLIVFMAAVVFVATYGDPYDVGAGARVVIAAIGLLGGALAGACAALLWRRRGGVNETRRT